MIDDVGQPILITRLRSDERKIKLTFVVLAIFLIILIINIMWVNTLVIQSKSSAASTIALVTPTITPTSPSPVITAAPVMTPLLLPWRM